MPAIEVEAWVLGPDATLVRVEPDADRFLSARRTLGDISVELIQGDWEDVLPDRAPFDLIFFDGARASVGCGR